MQKPCNLCGGTGQISFFKGVSRFLLSVEECPECAGLGYEINKDLSEETAAESSNQPSNDLENQN